MSSLNSFSIFCREVFAMYRLLKEESIMHISCGMALRLEKSIKVPERTFNISVCWHFIETHFEKDFSEVLSNLQKRMKMTTFWNNSN